MPERFETKWIAVSRDTVGKDVDAYSRIFPEVTQSLILNYILLARAVYYYTPDSGREHESIIRAEVNTLVGPSVVGSVTEWLEKNRAKEIVPTIALPIDPMSQSEVDAWFARHFDQAENT